MQADSASLPVAETVEADVSGVTGSETINIPRKTMQMDMDDGSSHEEDTLLSVQLQNQKVTQDLSIVWGWAKKMITKGDIFLLYMSRKMASVMFGNSIGKPCAEKNSRDVLEDLAEVQMKTKS